MRAALLPVVVVCAYACAQTAEDDLAGERDSDGGSGKGGSATADGGPWPDGAPSGGASGSTANGGAGGTGGGASGGSGGSTGGSGGSTGGSGGCAPITCKNWSSCQDESQCVASCPPAPNEICNLKDDDCSGGCDDGAGCRVGVHRFYSAGTAAHFYTTNVNEACCGFSLEFANFFYVYSAAESGLVAFYRCYLSSGTHFYTTSSSCEGAAGVNEGALGYIASSQVCGSVPLYRLVKPANGAHFYTTSEAEKNSAVSSSGYVYESIAGYVWSAP